jgi:hypothetical protein
MKSADLAARASRAYELGRLRWAFQVAWVVATLVALSCVIVGASPVSAATGIALLTAATVMRWRGRVWSAAVETGLLAGLFPFALLLFLKSGSGYLCALGGCMAHCAKFCGLGGLAAGFLIASRARRVDGPVAQFLIATTAVAALTGLLGCFVGGLMGVFWMIVGEVAATLPVYALQPRRR